MRHESCAKMPRSAFRNSLDSRGVLYTRTPSGRPLRYNCTRSPLRLPVMMYGPKPHWTPVFSECVPVTYDSAVDSTCFRGSVPLAGVLRPSQYRYGVTVP